MKRMPALGVVGLLALLAGGVLVARAARYDWFGDELYFLAAGHHPDVGYVDQGPLIPLLARAADAVAPDSLTVLRLPAILAGVAAIIVAALTAREFEGGRAAQILAGIGYASCPWLITQTASLSTFALDSTAVALVVWLLVRWVRLRQDRLLLVAGVVVVIDLQVKLLIPVVVAALAIGVACCGPRDIVRRPTLWLAAGVVLLAAVPALLWQWRHDWPQWAMGPVIRDEQQAATGGAAGLPVQLAVLAGVLGCVLTACAAYGVVRTRLRAYGFLAVAALVVAGFVVAVGGRPYYLAGLLPAVFAAGACVLVENVPARWWKAAAVVATAISAVIVSAVVVLLPSGAPAQPVTTRAEMSVRMRISGTTGRADLVSGVLRASASAGRERIPVITRTYWQAAILVHARDPRMPLVYSADRGYALFGRPDEDVETVLCVDTAEAAPRLRHSFSDVRALVRLDDPRGFPGIDARVTVWRCAGPREPWARLWPELTTYVLDPGI